MKRELKLDDQQLKQLEYFIGEIPTKYTQGIIQLLNICVKEQENDNNSKTDPRDS